MYIYTVTIHLQDHCAYLDIFTKNDVGVFGLKCVKLSTFCILEDYLSFYLTLILVLYNYINKTRLFGQLT